MYTNLRRLALPALITLAFPAVAEGPDHLVVIDPGHGGSNVGAPGIRPGIYEKQVTLAVARALADELEERGVRVVFTRERDEYVTLGERVRRANEAGGQLLVSLHANASPDHRRRGVETFIAAREFIDVQATQAGLAQDPLEAVRGRAAVRARARSAARLGWMLESHLARVRPGDRGVRQAAYDVLEGVDMPAALVEVGFIDHAVEGAELLRAEVVRSIARALAEGIVEFLGRVDAEGRAAPAQ